MTVRLAWKTGYEGDEVALGVALAIALHAIPIAIIYLKAAFPSPPEVEEALIASNGRAHGAVLVRAGA